MDTGGNCECLLHRPCAGCHRLLDAAHGQEVTALLDIGASHRAGEENLLQ
jgi:hypothetical protein